MSYKVGQILYVVPTKSTTVVPTQVIEEITKKTLTGTEIDYVVKVGGTEPKTHRLKDINGEVFETADKARIVLIDRATKSVTKLVQTAHAKARQWYPTSFEDSAGLQVAPELSELDEEDHVFNEKQESTIQLADGTIARVKLPAILNN